MNSTTRLVLIAFVILGLGLALAPLIVDWNAYKPQAEAWLSRKTGHRVSIAGNLSARLLPSPRLILNRIEVSGAAGFDDEKLLTAEMADARIALWPLLIGRIDLTSLEFERPTLLIERGPDGRLNIALGDQPPERRIIRAGFGFRPGTIAVDRIAINHGTLHIRDRLLNWSERLQDVNATIAAAHADGSYRAKAQFQWAGQSYGLDAELNAAGANGMRPLTVALKQAAMGLRANLSSRVRGGSQWQMAGALNVQIESAKPVAMTKDTFTAPLLVIDGAWQLDPEGAGLRDAMLRWGDFAARGEITASFGSAPALAVRARGSQLNLDAIRPDLAQTARAPFWPLAALQTLYGAKSVSNAERGIGAIWRGSADVKLDALIFAQGRIANPTLLASFSAGTAEIKDLSGVFPGEAELHIKGVAREDGFSGEAALAGERARELLLWAGLPTNGAEAGRLGPLGFRGGLELGPGLLRLTNFEAGLDGGSAKGLLALAHPLQSGPQIEADLQITRANIEPYRSLFAAETAPLEALLKVIDNTSGPVKFAIGTLVTEGFEAHGIEADLTLSASGGTAIKVLKIDDLMGATVQLAGDAKALSGPASLNLAGTASGLDLRPLLAKLGLAAPKGEAPLGPARFDVKAALQDGTGEMTADGVLAGAKAGVRMMLEGAQAPIAGWLGAGTLSLRAVVLGETMVVPGRLLGYDPPLAATAALAPDVSGPAYLLPNPPQGSAVSPGQIWYELKRSPGYAAITLQAGLTGGAAALSYERKGEPKTASYTVKLDSRAKDSDALFAALGRPDGLHQKLSGPFALVLEGRGNAGTLEISQAQLSLGAISLHGDGRLGLTGERPAFTGSVHAGTLDADALLALLPRAYHTNAALTPFDDTPLDLSVFGRWDAALSLDAEQLTIAHLPFSAPKFSVALKEGTLNISELRASLFGGSLTANIALRGGSVLPGFAASVKFIQTDGAALTRALWGQPFLTAQLGGSLSLTAEGASMAALAASANGTLALRSAAGTFAGIDPTNVLAITAFTDFAADASIVNGTALLHDSRMRSADGWVGLTGRAALAPFSVNLAIARENRAGQVLIEGPLDAPSRKLQ